MQTILEMLYFGQIKHGARTPKDPCYAELVKKTIELRNEFLSGLNEEQKELWKAMLKEALNCEFFENLQITTDAFRFGKDAVFRFIFGDDDIDETDEMNRLIFDR